MKLLRRQNWLLKSKLRKKDDKINQLYKAKRERRSATFTKNLVHKALEGSFSLPQRTTIINKKTRPRQWCEKDVINGLMLRSFSRKAFNFIREKSLLPLPADTTLRRWVKNFHCQPGHLHDVHKILQQYLQAEQSPLSKFAVLSFDEMEISKRFEYDQESDRIYGPYKKLQLVVARGLFRKWKQPIFYEFDTPMKKELLFSVIEAIEEKGVTVCGISFDLGNLGLLNSLGVTPEQPFFQNPSGLTQKIYIFPDAPHMLKLCRNHLLDDGYQLEVGCFLKKTDIEQVLLADSAELKLCPSVSLEHLDCQGNARQRVRPAAQLLSHSVATALRCLHPEKSKQADWIETVNSWFDVMNSRQQFDSNSLKCAFGVHYEEQKAALEEMCQAVSTMRSMKHKNLLPFQKGILIGSNALIALFNDMKQNFNIQYIRTSGLNQDACENLFSRLRALGISDDHPGEKQLPQVIQPIQIFRILHYSSSLKQASEVDPFLMNLLLLVMSYFIMFLPVSF